MPATDSHIHSQLIADCVAGDRQAQRQLYHQYAKAMLNTAYRIVKNRQEAEDILQEAFLAAFRSLHGFRAEAQFGSWLKRIVINQAINSLRRKQLLYINLDEEVHDIPDANTPYDSEALELEVKQAQEALLQLPTGYRTVFSLYVLEGYDHAEIAGVLGISISTSISQLSRAKQKIRTLLANKQHHGQTRKMV